MPSCETIPELLEGAGPMDTGGIAELDRMPAGVEGEPMAPAELATRWHGAVRSELVATLPRLWLLLRPDDTGGPASAFHTRVAGPETLELRTLAALRLRFGGAGGGLSSRWRLIPIGKRANSPWCDRVLVGRARNNDLVIRHASVSKLHAFFEARDHRLVLCDAGSKNGIGADQRSQDEVVVTAGVRLRIGAVRAVAIACETLVELMLGQRV